MDQQDMRRDIKMTKSPLNHIITERKNKATKVYSCPCYINANCFWFSLLTECNWQHLAGAQILSIFPSKILFQYGSCSWYCHLTKFMKTYLPKHIGVCIGQAGDINGDVTRFSIPASFRYMVAILYMTLVFMRLYCIWFTILIGIDGTSRVFTCPFLP